MIVKTIKIMSFDVHPGGIAKVSALQRYMQQAAREDCDSFGATYNALAADRQAFVLTTLLFEIYAEIHTDDEIEMTTVSRCVHGPFFIRDYVLKRAGETVAMCTTEWVLINLDKRNVLRSKSLRYTIPDNPIDGIGFNMERRHGMPGIPDGAKKGLRKVVFSDLDENNHLNNCVYTDILTDFAGYNPYEYRISKIRVDFGNECLLGENVEIYTTEGKLVAVNAENGKTSFSIEYETSKLLDNKTI